MTEKNNGVIQELFRQKNMQKEVYETLKEKYPLLFTLPEQKIIYPIQAGIECGPGWYNIIAELCQKIDIEIRKQDDTSIFFVTQIKEKFGTLRFYMHCTTYEMDVIIDHTEELSAKTCEMCGNTANTIKRNGWLSTLCPECQRH